MGNLGTIIRAITGFGIKNLGIIKPGVDIFNPKVIRASIFSMNFNEFNDYNTLHNNDVYTFLLDRQSTRISEIYVNKGSNFALLLGTEGSGLGEKYSDSERKVIIPHSTDIDSLNLLDVKVMIWPLGIKRSVRGGFLEKQLEIYWGMSRKLKGGHL